MRLRAWLLGVLALTAGPALLAPTGASARQLSERAARHHSERAAEGAAETSPETPGETGSGTPSGSGSGTPGEPASGETGESGSRHGRGWEKRAARRARCTVELKVPAGPLTAGETATLTGVLVCPEATDAAEQTVTIYRHTAHVSGYSPIGTTTTASDGTYQFTTEALDGNGAFYASATGRRSRHSAVKVTPLLTISGPPQGSELVIAGRRASRSATASDAPAGEGTPTPGDTPALGNTVTFTGTVSPAATDARVILQRESATAPEDWHRIGIGTVGPGGEYSITHTFGIPGQATIRTVVRVRGSLPAASEPLSYEIAPRQNPRLTIHASAQPLPYGQSVTLSGVSAAGAGEPLTLLAASRGGSFETVATVTPEASGDYEFPAQTPLRSTYYKVRSARTSSANLFEGVKPLLTATVSATSIASGQVLTFSGTIAPDHTGQVIYLERQSSSGIGFHVVAQATVATGSSFVIEHIVVGVGPQVYRIKVPRDEESQATASELLKVEVTPVTPEVLEPAEPGSGSPPSGES